VKVTIKRRPNPPMVTQADIDAMQATCLAVPVPASLVAEPDMDKTMTVLSGVELWEFGPYFGGVGPTAGFEGHIPDVTTHSGVYSAASKMGYTAPGFSCLAGCITVADAQAGVIDHVLAIAMPARAHERALPANRTDGKDTSATSMPEGARIFIDRALDIHALGLAPFTLMLADAAQRKGMMICDQSSAVAFRCEDRTWMGKGNPWLGAKGLLKGKGGAGIAQELFAKCGAHMHVAPMTLLPWP
jgi:hypothetical protein